MKENNIKNERSSIEEGIKKLEEKMNKELDFLIEDANKTEQLTAISIIAMKEPIILLFLSILSDYKRVLKENEIYKKNSEIMSKENLSTAEQLKVEIKENFRLKNQLENNRKEYQETYKDVRKELKELKKENEELKNAVNVVNKEKADWIRAYQEEKDKQFELLRSSIPIQEVKDIIEELKKNLHTVEHYEIVGAIHCLQKLLEGRK